jgi:hypothetical protein
MKEKSGALGCACLWQAGAGWRASERSLCSLAVVKPGLRIEKARRDSSLRDPAHKKRAQEKAGSLRSE